VAADLADVSRESVEEKTARYSLEGRIAVELAVEETVHATARGSVAVKTPSSAPAIEAAVRLGEMLRSDNLESAMWADEVIKRHILPETSKHTSGLAGWYSPGS
jgi:hypothetical protein